MDAVDRQDRQPSHHHRKILQLRSLMKFRAYLTTTFCAFAGLGIMTSPVWFSDWVHPAASSSASEHRTKQSCKNGYYALTFDDGPFPGHTDKLVATRKRLHVRATFFN